MVNPYLGKVLGAKRPAKNGDFGNWDHGYSDCPTVYGVGGWGSGEKKYLTLGSWENKVFKTYGFRVPKVGVLEVLGTGF